MSIPVPAEPSVLVFGLLAAPELSLEKVLSRVSSVFGPIRAASAERVFSQSGYYEAEMGRNLRRVYLAMDGTVDPGELARLKTAANALEDHWRQEGRRRVNADPGLLDLTHLVLATGKPAAHRVYLGEGIHAEIEYVFESGSFRPLPWTYPDYREAETIEFFNGLRRAHKAARKPAAGARGVLPPAGADTRLQTTEESP